MMCYRSKGMSYEEKNLVNFVKEIRFFAYVIGKVPFATELCSINPFLSIKKSGLDILLTGYNNLTLQTY